MIPALIALKKGQLYCLNDFENLLKLIEKSRREKFYHIFIPTNLREMSALP